MGRASPPTQVSFNITPPVNIANMFTGWLNGINKKFMYKILVGASALCWTICLSRNEIVCNNTGVVTPMHVIFRVTIGSIFWALLQKEDEQSHIIQECRVLEAASMEIFASNGWFFSNEIVFTWCLTLF
jgi:hypothetical protein